MTRSFPNPPEIVLGSRSPQRRDLLAQLIPCEQIRIHPPPDEDEPGFAGLHSLPEILQRLTEIARDKNNRVADLLSDERDQLILTADTVVIAGNAEQRVVLGKPDGPDWQKTVRRWFHDYYFGRTHQVATAVCLRSFKGQREEFAVVTEVRFRQAEADLLEWYLATEEPLGKAGGYGIQSAGSLFLESLQGSLSNVIGLPLEEVWRSLRAFDRPLRTGTGGDRTATGDSGQAGDKA